MDSENKKLDCSSPIWQRISRYFSKKEQWGNPDAISGLLLMTLYQIRYCSGWPIIIHCGTQGKHCKNSFHYKGLAVDFHFDANTNNTLLEQTQHLLKFLDEMQLTKSVGLGLYPEWHHSGFHFDVRGYRARWAKIGGEYVSFAEGLKFIESKDVGSPGSPAAYATTSARLGGGYRRTRG